MNNELEFSIFQWRQRWLSSIRELTSLTLQKKTWLNKENTNPHWSYVEFMCCYFDDLNIEDDYNTPLKEGWISIREYEAIRKWHDALDKYSLPNNTNVYDFDAILKDKEWLRVISIGIRAKNKLKKILEQEEINILTEPFDSKKINNLLS